MDIQLLKEVENRHVFVLHDGRTLASLQDLADVLPSLSESVFYHHVNADRHDFYNWAKDVFQHSGFSQELLLCTTPEQVLHCIEHWLAKAAFAQEEDYLSAKVDEQTVLLPLQELTCAIGMLPSSEPPQPPQPTIFKSPNQSPMHPPSQPSKTRIASTLQKRPQAKKTSVKKEAQQNTKALPDKPLKAQRIQPKTMQELVKKLKEVYKS
ncbi:hypothetical protein HZB00_03745 [Candidatus Woesearchaeota archaeon]|nr:hypothetical protein [Candidatus Woesearchaeota archaeon]